MGKNGKFGMGLAVPIINNENSEYVGMLVGALPTQEFFERYGNIIDSRSPLIVAIDKMANYLIAGSDENIGKNFFSDEIQQQIGGSQELNDMYEQVFWKSLLCDIWRRRESKIRNSLSHLFWR